MTTNTPKFQAHGDQAKHWRTAGLVVWLVAAFLLLNSPLLQMHPDEELSYESTNGDLAFTLDYQMSVKDNQAPLWFVTFWAWRQTVGDAEATSRVFSVLGVMLALAVTYRLGRRWFRSEWVGLAAPLLLIGNGLFFNYALDIRPYPMVMLSAALSMWAFTRWLDGGTLRRALIYGLSLTLLLYVHYLLIFLVIVQGVYFVAVRARERRWWRWWGQALAAGALGIALWLPWLPTFVNQVVGLKNIEAETGTGRGVAGIGVSTQATTPATILDLLNQMTNHLIWLYGLVLLVGMILLWRNRRYWLALLWALGVPAVAFALNLWAAVYAPRFVSHALLGFALALAAALMALPRRVGFTGVAILMAVNVLTLGGAIPVRVPYRAVYSEMSALVQPGDVVLNAPANQYDNFVRWQQKAYLPAALQESVTTDVAEAAEARRVWFLTASWFDPTVQDQFKQLEPTHPVQEVIGQCPQVGWCYYAQLMEAPPLRTPERFGANMDFWGADVMSVDADAITTHLWWRVEEAPPLDYSISLRLIDANGKVAAQSDGPIVHYGVDTVQTSQLEPDKIYIDYRTLDLPPQLSPGAYRLALVVYQSWDGQRLTLPDGSDTLMLDTLTIP